MPQGAAGQSGNEGAHEAGTGGVDAFGNADSGTRYVPDPDFSECMLHMFNFGNEDEADEREQHLLDEHMPPDGEWSVSDTTPIEASACAGIEVGNTDVRIDLLQGFSVRTGPELNRQAQREIWVTISEQEFRGWIDRPGNAVVSDHGLKINFWFEGDCVHGIVNTQLADECMATSRFYGGR